MLLRAQLADDRAEDAGADRLLVVVDQHRRVRIEADGRAVGTMDVLGGADDDRLVDVALLDAAARRGLLHRDADDVADAGEAALGAAQHLDALDALCAAVVGDLEVRLHLDHRSNSFFFLPGSPAKAGAQSFIPTSAGPRPSPGNSLKLRQRRPWPAWHGCRRGRAPATSSASRSAASLRCG